MQTIDELNPSPITKLINDVLTKKIVGLAGILAT